MNIVMVTHKFPRAEGDLSGSAIWRLAEGLVHRGHGVTVVCPADRGDVGEPMLGHVKVRRVRYAQPSLETLAYQGTMGERATRPLGAVTFLRLMRALSRAVTQEVRATQANCIHAHWWTPAALALRFCDRAGRPYVVTMYDRDVALTRRIPLGRLAMKFTVAPAATVTAVATYLSDAVAGTLGISPGDVPVTPMPLALGRSPDPDAARQGAIYVGRLTRSKGVHHLLEALAMLKRGGYGQDLTIVGDGPERSALKAQAIALGLTTVFTGHIAPELVNGHLRDKRVFISPSMEEGLSLNVAEALTQGVPVVATRVGGAADYFADPDCGVLVPPDDPMALAVAIRQVAGEDRYRVGAFRASRTLTDRLSSERVAARFESLYLGIRGRRTGAMPRPSGPQQRLSGPQARPSGPQQRPSGPQQRPDRPSRPEPMP